MTVFISFGVIIAERLVSDLLEEDATLLVDLCIQYEHVG
jgi:hypothetical protein